MEGYHNKQISIVLATYNGEKYLHRLLISLINQTLYSFEIIVIDDCSTDKSVEIVEEFRLKNKNIQLYINERNFGPVQSFSKGISLSTGEYIALADQDDIWLPNKLKLSFEAIERVELPGKPALIYTDLSTIDEDDQLLEKSFWSNRSIDPRNENFFTLLFSNIITGCTIFLNRPLANICGIIPDNVLMHDHWLGLIAYSLGNAEGLQIPTLLYRVHNESVTTKVKPSKLLRFKTNARFLVNGSNYLEKNFRQAKAFKALFYDVLSHRDRTHIDKFLGLENKSIFYKKFSSLTRYMKP